MSKTRFLIIALACFAFCAALAGCSSVPSSSSASAPENSSSPSVEANIEDTTPATPAPEGYVPGEVREDGNTLSYRNDAVGISFDFPSGAVQGDMRHPGRECAMEDGDEELFVDYASTSERFSATDCADRHYERLAMTAGDIGYSDLEMTDAKDGASAKVITYKETKDGKWTAIGYVEGSGHVLEITATAPDAQTAKALVESVKRI